jgi:hypothetical protein
MLLYCHIRQDCISWSRHANWLFVPYPLDFTAPEPAKAAPFIPKQFQQRVFQVVGFLLRARRCAADISGNGVPPVPLAIQHRSLTDILVNRALEAGSKPSAHVKNGD